MGTQLPSRKRGGAPNFRPMSVVANWLHGLRRHLVGRYSLGPNRPSSHLPKKGAEPPPQLSPYVYSGQTAAWITIALGMEVSLGPGHIVLNGDPATLPKKGQSPQFSAHVYCGHGRPSQLLLSSCMKLSMCQCNLVHLTDIL